MTIVNLYAKYLLADRLNKIAEAAGVGVDSVHIDNAGSYQPDVHFQASLPIGSGGRESERNERAAILLLDAMPELALERRSGLIYLTGIAPNGLTFRFYTGSGSCERVQVGTRIVPAEPAKPEREEPVFEVRCVDDLAGLVSA